MVPVSFQCLSTVPWCNSMLYVPWCHSRVPFMSLYCFLAEFIALLTGIIATCASHVPLRCLGVIPCSLPRIITRVIPVCSTVPWCSSLLPLLFHGPRVLPVLPYAPLT